MKSKLLLNAFILLVLFSSVSAVVAAQMDFFSSFDTITGGRDLGEFYNLHASWIDLIIYVFLFIYVAQFGFKNNQSTSGMGKALPTIVGIALAIGAMVAENQFSFNLGMLGPFALGIALLVIAFTVYKAVHGMGLGGASSWAFAYIIVYGFLTSAAAELFKTINEKVPFVGSFMAIGLVIAIVAAVMAIINWAKQGGLGGGININDTAGKVEGRTESQEDRDARAAEKILVAERNVLNKLEGLSQRELKDVGNIIKDIDLIVGVLRSGKVRRESYEQIKNIIGTIQPSWHDVVSVGKGITALSNELDQLEAAEMKYLQDEARKAFGLVQTEQKNKFSGVFKGQKAVASKQTALIADAQRSFRDKANIKKNQLNQRILDAQALEPQVVQPFQRAMAAISGNQSNLAVKELESAKTKLVELGKLLQQIETSDVKRLMQDITREFRDQNTADKLAVQMRRVLPK